MDSGTLLLVDSQKEFAGLGGDVHHLKTELEGQQLFSLKDFVFLIFSSFISSQKNLSLSLRTGYLHPLHASSSTRINERFYLGGPLTIRGFKQYGVGPRQGTCVLGGDTYWASGVSLFTPLPFMDLDTFRGHLFANAGSLISLDRCRLIALSWFLALAIKDALLDLTRPSIAAGVGLLVRFSFLRFEVNYCVPVVVRETDVVKPGIQFGIGLEFM